MSVLHWILVYCLLLHSTADANSSTIFVKRKQAHKKPLIQREFVFMDAPQAFQTNDSPNSPLDQTSSHSYKSSSGLNSFGQTKPYKTTNNTLAPKPLEPPKTRVQSKANSMIQPSQRVTKTQKTNTEEYKENDWEQFALEEDADYVLEESASVSAVLK